MHSESVFSEKKFSLVSPLNRELCCGWHRIAQHVDPISGRHLNATGWSCRSEPTLKTGG